MKFGRERVMGYYRPIIGFNLGKKSEVYSRQYFKIDEAVVKDNKKFIEEYKNGNLES